MIAKEKKQEIIAKYGRTANDTGSPEVQVALAYLKKIDIERYRALIDSLGLRK